ncbi:MAG: DUF1127 domain-containing protein [Pseudomonadota bacterium]
MAHSIQHGMARAKRSGAKPGFGQRLWAMVSLQRQRHALSELDDHRLKDIGVTREQADAEARKTPWDIPEYWRH